jgi:hypothetical protein
MKVSLALSDSGGQVALHVIAIFTPLEMRKSLLGIYALATELSSSIFPFVRTGRSYDGRQCDLGWLLTIVVYSLLGRAVIAFIKHSGKG